MPNLLVTFAEGMTIQSRVYIYATRHARRAPSSRDAFGGIERIGIVKFHCETVKNHLSSAINGGRREIIVTQQLIEDRIKAGSYEEHRSMPHDNVHPSSAEDRRRIS